MSLNGNRTSLCAPVGWTAVSMPRTPTKAGIKTAMPKSVSRILFMSFLLGDFQTACFCYCIPHRKLPEEPACADTCLRRERGRQAADRRQTGLPVPTRQTGVVRRITSFQQSNNVFPNIPGITLFLRHPALFPAGV